LVAAVLLEQSCQVPVLHVYNVVHDKNSVFCTFLSLTQAELWIPMFSSATENYQGNINNQNAVTVPIHSSVLHFIPEWYHP
jgi:hypothetical protein